MSYHYLHFSSTVINFFLYCLWEEGNNYEDVLSMIKVAHNEVKIQSGAGILSAKNIPLIPLMVTEGVLGLRSLLNFHT